MYMFASENLGQAFRRFGYFRNLSTQMKAEAQQIKDMQAHDVSDTIQKGGTVLYTARCKEMRTEEGVRKAAAVRRACAGTGRDGNHQLLQRRRVLR